VMPCSECCLLPPS